MSSSSAPAAGFYVIINPQNPVTSVSRKFVMDAFLKKVTQWGDLFGIRPVDLRVDSSVRNAFSTELLKRSVSAVKTYWQQMVANKKTTKATTTTTNTKKTTNTTNVNKW